MDDNDDCLRRIVDFNESFFFYDPDIRIQNRVRIVLTLLIMIGKQRDVSLQSLRTKNFSRHCFSGNFVKVEVDNNNNNKRKSILDSGEGSDNTDDEIDNSNNDTDTWNDTKTLDHKKLIMLGIIVCATTKMKAGSSKKRRQQQKETIPTKIL